jgi:hypothetical protein
MFLGRKASCIAIVIYLDDVGSALNHFYTDWLLIAMDTNNRHETKETNYAWECSVMRKMR